jgi:hypothetical protein
MPHDSNNKGPSSAPTSSNAPKTPLSEAAFVTVQAANAKAAISATFDQMKRDLAQGADPRAWLAVAPWTTLAGAAVAGFVAAAAMVPSKEQQALKRLERIEKALNPQPRPVDAAVNGDGPRKVEAGQGSFLAGLAGQVLRAVQPVLMSAITAGITAKTVKPEEPTGGADPSSAAYGQPAPSGDSPEI